MKNIFVTLFCQFMAFGLFAQEPLQTSDYIQIKSFPEGKEHRTLVFGDKINVRVAPKKDAQVLTQLLAGEAVAILASDAEQLTLNGWTTSWVKIAFNKNGKRQEGYAWGGVLAFNALVAGDVSFVYGVAKKAAGDPEGFAKHEIEIRAVRGNQIISSAKTEIGMESAYDTQALLFSGLGLKSQKNVLRFDFSFGACGYNQYEIYCLWDGAKLSILPTLSSVSDAGIFAYSESFLFPESKDGIPETLLFQTEETQGMIEEGDYKFTHRVRKMNWNGKAWEKPNMEAEVDAGN